MACFILVFSFFNDVKATRTIGADISWTSKKAGEYKINYRVFRDCWATGVDTNMKLRVRCLETNAVKEMAYDTSSFKTKAGLPTCEDTFTCYPKHFEQTFNSFLDFNTDSFLLTQIANGGCRFEIEFSTLYSYNWFNKPPRSFVYVSSMMNICNLNSAISKIDNSPQFSFNPNLVPGCNQPVHWSPGVYDMEKDSLVFSLIDPRSSLTHSINYKNQGGMPLSIYCRRYDNLNSCTPRPERNPPEGFYFDSTTGNMVFQPTDCDETTQMALKVDQYRLDSTGKKMLHLGYVTQEFRFDVRHYVDNNPPILKVSGVKPICEGEKICIEVDVLDKEYEDKHGKQNWKDTLELDWNHSIPNAVWETDSTTNFYTVNSEYFAQRKGKLCWQTDSDDAGFDPYFVTFYTKDKGCRFNAIAKRTYLIYVYPNIKAESQRIFNQDSFGNLFIEHIASGKDTFFNRYNKYDFTWQIKDLSDNSVVSISKNQIDTLGFLKPGAYEIMSTVSYAGSPCSEYFYDTIYISCELAKFPEIRTPSVPDICIGDSFCFDIEVTVDLNQASNPTPAIHAIELSWDQSIAGAKWTLDSSRVFSDSSGTYAYRKAQFCLQTDANDMLLDKSFKVVAKNSNCSYYDSATKVIDFKIHTFPSAIRHFAQDSTGVLYFGSVPNESGSYNHLWEIRDSTNSGTPYYTSQKEVDSFSLSYPGTFIVTYKITNQAGCSKTYLDTLTICTDNNAPEFDDVVLNPICAGDTLCFDVEVYDEQSSTQTWSDTIEMDWDRSIANATWEVDTPSFVTVNNVDYAYRKARFCWATEPEDGKTTPYFVNIFASDMACPAKAVAVKTVAIYVNPNPTAQRLYNQDNLGKLFFESFPDNSANAIHEWEIRDSTNTGTPLFTSNEIKDTVTFQQAGNYAVNYTITDTITDCFSVYTDTILINRLLSSKLLQFGQLKVFPNPADEVVFIEAQSSTIESLKVYDVSGKVILEKAIHDKTFKVETKSWAPGTHIFEIKSNEQVFRFKQLIVNQ